MTIIIKEDYEKLVPPMSQKEYQALNQSIKEQGKNMIPVIINQDDILLDGHYRLKACTELGIKFEYQVMKFTDQLEEKKFVIETNLIRRQLNEFQRVECGLPLEEMEKEKARQRKQSTLPKKGEKGFKHPLGAIQPVLSSAEDTINDQLRQQQPQENQDRGKIGRVSHIVASKILVSHSTYERGKLIVLKGTDEQKERLRKGISSITREYNLIKQKERQDQLIKQASKAKAIVSCLKAGKDNRFKLIQSDFQDIDHDMIPNDSIDLICTNPLYNKERLCIYEQLGRLASRVLRDGGSLVMHAENFALPQIFEAMKNSGLKYWSQIAVKHNGVCNLFQRHVHLYVIHEPLLWFVKGDKSKGSNSLKDLIESQSQHSAVNEWQQSTVEAKYVISGLTIEDDIVLDPLMHKGTIGIAAINLGRQFIGIEQDPELFNMAKARIELADYHYHKGHNIKNNL
jgi:ParB-like chromosome segregation protein Spo0J